MYTQNKGFVYGSIKEMTTINKKKKNDPIFSNGQKIEQTIYKKDTQMANKHTKSAHQRNANLNQNVV